MDMNTETTATKPAGFPKTAAPQAFRGMAEKGTTQSKETYEKMNRRQLAGLQFASLSNAAGDLQCMIRS
jgi:hypothetical protein